MNSLFKASLTSSDPCWRNPNIKTAFDIAFHIRDVMKKAIYRIDPVNFELIVCAESELYQYLNVLQASDQYHYSSLCEVLQVSKVVVLPSVPKIFPDEVEILESSYDLKTEGINRSMRLSLFSCGCIDFTVAISFFINSYSIVYIELHCSCVYL